jgi:mRNA-degrading endonuclease YafQ of YafQ-DinJ toxin-antitoxin module
MHVFQTNSFKKALKKLYPNQKAELDEAVHTIIKDPLIGSEKVGDLSGVRGYKFHISNQLNLLAYQFDVNVPSLTLLALGAHENFYRDLKPK